MDVICGMKKFTQQEFIDAFRKLSASEKAGFGSERVRELQHAFAAKHGLTDRILEDFLYVLDCAAYKLITTEEVRKVMLDDLGCDTSVADALPSLWKDIAEARTKDDHAVDEDTLDESVEDTVDFNTQAVEAAQVPSGDVSATTTNTHSSQSPLEQFLKKDADVQARFEKLPETVRSAVLSPEVAAQFSAIVREHAMEQEAFMTFGTHVVRVLAGLENVNELRTTLREKKIVAHEEVEPVAQKVEAGMVKPVRDAIVAEVEKRKGK